MTTERKNVTNRTSAGKKITDFRTAYLMQEQNFVTKRSSGTCTKTDSRLGH
jgi:hypothetical protein